MMSDEQNSGAGSTGHWSSTRLPGERHDRYDQADARHAKRDDDETLVHGDVGGEMVLRGHGVLDEALLEGAHFPHDPGGRRAERVDLFVDCLERRLEIVREQLGPRGPQVDAHSARRHGDHQAEQDHSFSRTPGAGLLLGLAVVGRGLFQLVAAAPVAK